MAAANSTSASTSNSNIDLTNILSAVQNWVVAENALNKQLSLVISSNHLNLSIPGVLTSTTPLSSGTVTTINTSIGLTGGPISTSGTLAVSLSKLTNSLSSDNSLTNIAGGYSDGPVVTQGTSGVWLATGTISFLNSAGSTTFFVKLWDGTTTIASETVATAAAGFFGAASLSGVITNPSSNIKMSATCNAASSATSLFKFNGNAGGGNSKDCTLTAIRIG